MEQAIAACEIERILKESGVDTALESIQCLAFAKVGKNRVHVAKVLEVHIDRGLDHEGLKVKEILLLFKGGLSHGSKANLPKP